MGGIVLNAFCLIWANVALAWFVYVALWLLRRA